MGGYFLIYIYVLSKWRVQYKLKTNEDIYFGINGNNVYQSTMVVRQGKGKVPAISHDHDCETLQENT